MSSSYTKTRIMVECALMIALGTILANIKIYERSEEHTSELQSRE